MSVAVIGLGNVLLGDDGFGPFVVERLQTEWELPDAVSLIDVGTPGLGMLAQLHGHESVIFVDAVAATGEPGDLRLYAGESLRQMEAPSRASAHDPAVQEVLQIADFAGCGPRDVLLVGVIPQTLEVGAPLSPPVLNACSTAVQTIVDTLAAWGFESVRRVPAPAANPWWARPPRR